MSFLALATAAALISPAFLARALGRTEASVLPVARVSQLAGADRALTAVALSRSTYLAGVDVVYIANGANGLLPPVVAENAPLLYVNENGRPSRATRREIARLEPSRIVILGDSHAVSQQLEDDLRRDHPKPSRFPESTSALLASSLSAELFPDGARVAYLVREDDIAAAVATSAVAANAGGPVLLTGADRPSHETMQELDRLGPQVIFVVGVAADDPRLADALRTAGHEVHTLGGADLHATAIAVAREAEPDRHAVYLLRPPTTDGAMADALATAQVAGQRNAAILWLDDDDEANASTLDELDRLQPQHMVLVGSAAGLSPSTREALEAVEHRPED